ncbi:MAG: hypothetical protein HRT55_08815 [Colwellia sp.]|nr:hypothetical protein [Colwellia sp.]NQZ26404.1 hypothetical protein [Colwellia sp.]
MATSLTAIDMAIKRLLEKAISMLMFLLATAVYTKLTLAMLGFLSLTN